MRIRLLAIAAAVIAGATVLAVIVHHPGPRPVVAHHASRGQGATAASTPTPVPSAIATPSPEPTPDAVQAEVARGGAPAGRGAPPPVGSGPTRLVIPRIGVNAAIESIGVAPDHSLGVPRTWFDVGWYGAGVEPGQPGDAVMDGHLDSTSGPAVFWRLGQLHAGDQVTVVFGGGEQRTFAVTTSYPIAAGAPLNGLFDTSGPSRLSLITCGGAWNARQHQYTQRLVVDATLVG